MKQLQLVSKILNYVSLKKEIDNVEKIHESISKDIVFKGTNFWVLIFAVVVASIGLNINSTAVIIGAMLISPLMGPSIGMGYSIATYNFPLLKKAAKNLSFAVAGSLMASTAYFAISPISTAHSELLARTSPNIYDVLIALFGGLAGIIAIASKQKGNVIPGVAIATALMPPLCTAGYGLATGHFFYFFGAIYLFTINIVFISFAALIVSQMLKFPLRAIVEDVQKKRINRWISIVIILIIIPSIYFGYLLVQKDKFTENANTFIKNVSIVKGNYLLKSQINPDAKTITLVYGGETMNENEKNSIIEKANDFSLNKAKIIFQKGLSFDFIDTKTGEVENLKGELNRLNIVLQEKQNQIDSIQKSRFIGKQILNEIKNLYPQIITCSYADSYVFNDTIANPSKIGIVAFTTQNNQLKDLDKGKINSWLKTRLKEDSITVYYQNIAIKTSGKDRRK
ncbi:MAG: DUF389 domain-containing protein [Bacteroidota bacterium]|nr:DUF389 domain-containing protein [Bacteroidota bacterium]